MLFYCDFQQSSAFVQGDKTVTVKLRLAVGRYDQNVLFYCDFQLEFACTSLFHVADGLSPNVQ